MTDARRLDVLFLMSSAAIGGAERQVLYLLDRLDRHEFRPSVATVLADTSRQMRSAGDMTREMPADVPCQRFDLESYRDFVGLHRVARTIGRTRWDIVQTFGLVPDLALRVLMPFLGRPRLIASVRGLELQRPSWSFRVDGLTHPLVSAYISNTYAARELVCRRGGIPLAKFVVIPNGIDARRFDGRRDPAIRQRLRGEWGVADNGIAIVAVGHLSQDKGSYDLIEAAADPRFPAGSAKIVFCGFDTTRGGVLDAARRRGVLESVVLLGRRDDVSNVLAASDIGILASHHEGMPNVLLEVMAAGLPAIATTVGGVPEVVGTPPTAVTVPPREPGALAQACARLVASESLRRELGAAGRRRVREEFDLSRMVRRTEAVYRGVLAGRSGVSLQAEVDSL